MAPATEPIQPGESKNLVKDALYLFELFRESPQAILINIGPYAAKTGTKPNTVIKRLGEIKKRNGLNIITSSQTQGDGAKSPAAAGGARKAGVTVKTKAKAKTQEDAKGVEGEKPVGMRKKRGCDDGLEAEDEGPNKKVKTED